MGVTLKQIREHLFDCIPGLKEKGICLDSIHRLMLPPRRKTIRSSQFKGLVNARVPAKKNDATTNVHQDLRYSQCQVTYVNELFPQFHQLRLSCDDKNKVNVGTPAVSRYHQIATFFLRGSEPNFFDHDFPYANSKIIPSGYLIMSEQEHNDRRGRPIIGP